MGFNDAVVMVINCSEEGDEVSRFGMGDVNIRELVLYVAWDLDGLELIDEIIMIGLGEVTSNRCMRCIRFNDLPVEVRIGLFNAIPSLIKKGRSGFSDYVLRKLDRITLLTQI